MQEVIDDRLKRLDALIAKNASEGFKTSIWIEPEDVIWAVEKSRPMPRLRPLAKTPTCMTVPAPGCGSREFTTASISGIRGGRCLERFMARLGERYRDNLNVLCYEVFEEPARCWTIRIPSPAQTIKHRGYSCVGPKAFRGSWDGNVRHWRSQCRLE